MNEDFRLLMLSAAVMAPAVALAQDPTPTEAGAEAAPTAEAAPAAEADPAADSADKLRRVLERV